MKEFTVISYFGEEYDRGSVPVSVIDHKATNEEIEKKIRYDIQHNWECEGSEKYILHFYPVQSEQDKKTKQYDVLIELTIDDYLEDLCYVVNFITENDD